MDAPTQEISDEPSLAAALAAEAFLLFKHSHRCPISARAFAEYKAWALGARVPTGWIDVVGERRLSQAVAARTGVEHESPQAILLRSGRAVWSASHGAITRASLARAVPDREGGP